MPDWKKFANLLGMAQHGDAVRGERERIRKEGIQAEELGFRRDANSRAGAAEGREAEGYEYSKGRRKSKEEADDLTLAAARFKNDRMPTEAKHADEDQQFQRNEQGRADTRLKQTGMQIAIQKLLAETGAGNRQAAADRAKEDQNFQRGQVQSAYDARNNPQGEALAKAKALQEIIDTSGDTTQVEDAKEQLAFIQAELDKERVLREVKRSTVVGR
jgi:hypothetical protein